MSTVNVGLIGAGFMGKAHSLAYAALPMFFWPPPATPHRLVLAEAEEERADTGARRFGFERATADWGQVVDDPDVDLVDISVPNDQHAEIAIAAARAGKHVICEKPLAMNSEETRQMLDAVTTAGVMHMVAFSYRRTPAVVLAHKLIEEGAIGTIRNFRGTYLQDWSNDRDLPLSWRFERAVAGSGALGDIGTHVLDIARYLVGEVNGVCASLQTYIHDRPLQEGGVDELAAAHKRTDTPRAQVDVDDEVMALLRFETGAVGSLEASRAAHGRKNFLAFEIHGEAGTITFDYERRDELRLYSTSDPDDCQGFRTILTGPTHPYGEGLWPIAALGIGFGETKLIECHDLMQAIATETLPSPNFEDGHRITVICEALERSAASGAWIDLEAVHGVV